MADEQEASAAKDGADQGRASEEARSTTEREVPSQLGGEVATRSGTAPTPDDEKAG